MDIKHVSGVIVCLIPAEKFKTSSVTVNFLAPLDVNTASLNALLCNVLRRGSADYPSLTELSIRLEELYDANLYISIRKKGELQVLSLGIAFLDNKYALEGEDVFSKAVDLLFGMITKPYIPNNTFNVEYVEVEKTNLIDYINSKINDKRSYAVNRCYELMCDNEPYGIDHHGKTDIIAGIDSNMLYNHYKTFIDETPMVVSCVGNYDEKALTEKIKCFKSESRAPLNYAHPEKKSVSEIRQYTDYMDVEQAKLSLGFRTDITFADGPAAVCALSLFHTVFGGSPHSKLFENVREKESLCYYCASRPDRLKGTLIVYSGVEDENIEKAKKEILHQLEEIKNGNISQNEMSAAAKALVNSYKSALDSHSQMEDFYLSQIIAGDSSDIEELADTVSSVTAKDVVKAAKGLALDTVYILRKPEKKGENDEH